MDGQGCKESELRIVEAAMSTRSLTDLQLGRIRYTNTLPFYHSLPSPAGRNGEEWQWEVGSPAEINRWIYEGKIDIAPISSLEYLNHQDQYLLFPELCIGSRDFSASVLLISKERIDGLNGATLSVSQESLSAAALLKILLKKKFGFENKFVVEPSNPPVMLEKSRACLVIGDEALFYKPKEFIYKTDLSQIWWEWTGRPFCFSLWAVRRSTYRECPSEVTEFYRLLKANLGRNLEDLEKLIREGTGVVFADVKFPTLFGYLFNLSYGLDEAMLQGLNLFFHHAHQMGISPEPKELEFVRT